MPDIYREPIIVPEPPVPAPPVLPKGFGPAFDVQNAVYLNDYRNRFPFKVDDEHADYEWVYGSTMNLVFTITDTEIPEKYHYEYVEDIRDLGVSVVDSRTKIATLTISSMAYESKDKYIPISAMAGMLASALNSINRVERVLIDAGEKYKQAAAKLKAAGAWPLNK